ncbi:unnamed protein product, partial [Medioppia subpectinata]
SVISKAIIVYISDLYSPLLSLKDVLREQNLNYKVKPILPTSLDHYLTELDIKCSKNRVETNTSQQSEDIGVAIQRNGETNSREKVEIVSNKKNKKKKKKKEKKTNKPKVTANTSSNKTKLTGDINLVVDVEPLRVVIHAVGLQRHSSHETKRFVKVFEHELLFDGIPSRLIQRPLVIVEQRFQFGLPLLFGQFASFGRHFSVNFCRQTCAKRMRHKLLHRVYGYERLSVKCWLTICQMPSGVIVISFLLVFTSHTKHRQQD